ncbi:MAG: cellulase family glycosylhydrolase [Armatimonadetes bacterium]|nr:cellulase family glycosylhydrolase [Armatimonadota bacterium]
MVDAAGAKVVLKGCNLGNWFVIEPWIMHIDQGPGAIHDQYELEGVLSKRFGVAEKNRLMEAYRSNWITEADFRTIRSFGFNLVRLPLNYRQFEDDANPMHLRADAWKWVDKAVDWAEKQGIYTILDMHGAQGGQTENDHTGRSGQNKLWSVPQNQQRLAWLWGEIAKRYRNRNAVVAYDVFNEPWGGSKADQVKVFTYCYDTIRKQDPDKLIFAMGHWDNFDHYGNPKSHGWKNVGFQMHYYPGMFGNGSPNLVSQAKHIANLKEVAVKVDQVNVPFLVGEMNVVFNSSGGAKMMRRYYDLHASYGWMTTVWTYKVLSKEGGFGDASWGMVTNVKPMHELNVHKDSLAEIEKYMLSLSTGMAPWGALRDALTAHHVDQPPLPELPLPRRTAPADERWAGWVSTDIGGSLKGGLVKSSANGFDLYGGGNDIWGGQDDFRFLHMSTAGDFDIEVTIDDVEEIDTYTKAGLMARDGLGSDAPMVMLSTFPSGEVQLALRKTKGGQAQGVASGRVTFPGAKFRLRRIGNTVTAWAGNGAQPTKIGEVEWTAPSQVEVGAVALSHAADRLARISYRDLGFRKG